MKINGKWYFNESIVTERSYREEVNFTSNGSIFNYMDLILVNPDVDVYLFGLEYNSISGPPNYADAVTSTLPPTRFNDEAYRTIDFGAAYQEVSDEFYNWLTANATQLSKLIPMTHPKGIRLLTKGKKCAEDIEVVPTFIETVSMYVETVSTFTGSVYYITIDENGQMVRKKEHLGEESNVTIYPIKNSTLLYQGDFYDSCPSAISGLKLWLGTDGYYNGDTDEHANNLYAYEVTESGTLKIGY